MKHYMEVYLEYLYHCTRTIAMEVGEMLLKRFFWKGFIERILHRYSSGPDFKLFSCFFVGATCSPSYKVWTIGMNTNLRWL